MSAVRRPLLVLVRARPLARLTAPRPLIPARRFYNNDSFPPSSSSTPAAPAAEVHNMQELGLNDDVSLPEDGTTTDWSRSFHGLSTEAFPKEVNEILMQKLDPEDVEIKPGEFFSFIFFVFFSSFFPTLPFSCL